MADFAGLRFGVLLGGEEAVGPAVGLPNMLLESVAGSSRVNSVRVEGLAYSMTLDPASSVGGRKDCLRKSKTASERVCYPLFTLVDLFGVVVIIVS